MARTHESDDISGDYWEQFRSNTKNADAALAELIDNSLDAGATEICVDYARGRNEGLVIRDNGSGMDADGLHRMFRLGGSMSKGDVRKSGRFGHGSKVGMAYFGRFFEITTTKEGERFRWAWDTQADIETKVWKRGLRKYKSKKTKDGNGTTIAVSRIFKQRRIGAKVWERLRWEFTPAMAKCRMLFNGERQQPMAVPWDNTPKTCDGEINGMKFTAQYGRLSDKASKIFQGVHCIRHNRFVGDLSQWKDPVDNTPLCVIVTFLVDNKDDWKLDSLKRGLADQSVKDDLEQEIRAICKDEIDKFQAEDQFKRCRELAGQLNDLASRRFAKGEAFGLQDDESGAVTTTTGGRGGRGGGGGSGQKPRSQADGSTHDNATGEGFIQFRFLEMDDEFTAVHFDKTSRTIVVAFNTNSEAYRLQPPDHTMYVVAAGYAIAAKMREDSRFIQMFREWNAHLDSQGWDTETINIDSKFCRWFQRQMLDVVDAIAA